MTKAASGLVKNWFSGQTYIGQGVAGGLAGQCRAPGQPGVYFDDVVLLGLGVQGVLDVALADDAQVADDLDGARPEHVVFSVGSEGEVTHFSDWFFTNNSVQEMKISRFPK